MIDATEKFWIGDRSCWTQADVVVNHMSSVEGEWFQTADGLVLDPDYSDWAVRIYHPKDRTLSFVLKTMAILPKSMIRRIYALLGEYIKYDEERANVK